MTHILILIEEGNFISRITDEEADDVMREIEEGSYELPPEIQLPCCFSLPPYVIVRGQPPMPKMTKVQRMILEKLAMGASMTEVAAVMHYSYDGIRYNVDALKRKFGVTTRAELVAAFLRYNPMF